MNLKLERMNQRSTLFQSNQTRGSPNARKFSDFNNFAIPASFSFILVVLNNFYSEYLWNNVYPAYGARIWTDDHQNMSFVPKPLDRPPPQKNRTMVSSMFFNFEADFVDIRSEAAKSTSQIQLATRFSAITCDAAAAACQPSRPSRSGAVWPDLVIYRTLANF